LVKYQYLNFTGNKAKHPESMWTFGKRVWSLTVLCKIKADFNGEKKKKRMQAENSSTNQMLVLEGLQCQGKVCEVG
jgi:hypothetical protein